MGQLRFPDMRPGFIRIELEHHGDLGWEVTVWETPLKRYTSFKDRQIFDVGPYEDAVAVVASVLDGIDPAG